MPPIDRSAVTPGSPVGALFGFALTLFSCTQQFEIVRGRKDQAAGRALRGRDAVVCTVQIGRRLEGPNFQKIR